MTPPYPVSVKDRSAGGKVTRCCVCRCIVAYILEDEAERRRLQIAFLPPLWPALCVRAPVPWRTQIVRARHAMRYRYLEGNPVLIELRRIWHER